MTRSTGKRRHHFKDIAPKDPAVKRISAWPAVNVNFFRGFCRWLSEGGYGPSSLNTYGVAARFALGWLDQPYWQIDPANDLARVKAYLATTSLTPATRHEYEKGLDKLADYLRDSRSSSRPPREVNWAHYTANLPPWLVDAVRAYVKNTLRTQRPENHHRATLEALGHLTAILRWMAAQVPLATAVDITPEQWFNYLEARLTEGIQPVTVNSELRRLQAFLHFLEDEGHPICERIYRLEPLNEPSRLPRDAPVSLLKQLLEAIQKTIASAHAGMRRMGLMDRAWVLLMLHSGLRTCEIRRLELKDIDWENRRMRIEQSKGLKDRLVYLSQPTIDAVQAYLALRGPALNLPERVFLYRHQPLSSRYCQVRLRTYGRRMGITLTPHQLRHSCATLLLNAGAPVLTVKTILGHKHVDTTLGYARLYDGTVAADYYRAMHHVESQLILTESALGSQPSLGELLALVDSLSGGTLNPDQAEKVASLRLGLLHLAQPSMPIPMGDVKVLVGG